MKITDPELRKLRGVHIQKNEYHEGKIKDHELVELYLTLYDDEIHFGKEEVRDGRFFSVSEIDSILSKNRDNFTPWFLDEWDYLEGLGLKQKLLRFFKS